MYCWFSASSEFYITRIFFFRKCMVYYPLRLNTSWAGKCMLYYPLSSVQALSLQKSVGGGGGAMWTQAFVWV